MRLVILCLPEIFLMIDNNEIKNELIEGRNAVIEALRAGRAIDKIFIARGDVDKKMCIRDRGRPQAPR